LPPFTVETSHRLGEPFDPQRAVRSAQIVADFAASLADDDLASCDDRSLTALRVSGATLNASTC
jgi:hypothetical protein